MAQLGPERNTVSTLQIKIKRIYDPLAAEDGQRVLIDRLWPCGVKRKEARLDDWLRDVAPSDALRCWFGHDPARWEECQARYRRELADGAHQAALAQLRQRARQGPLILLFATKDTEHNSALVIREALEA